MQRQHAGFPLVELFPRFYFAAGDTNVGIDPGNDVLADTPDLLCGRSRREIVLYAQGNLVLIGEQFAHLPDLCVRQRAMIARHPCQTDAVGDFPVRLADLIVRNAFAVHELRRGWIHALSGRSRQRQPHSTVGDRL